MLSNENRMTFHRRLFTIVFRILRRYSCGNEIDSMLPDCIDTFISDILPLLVGKFEFGSERGFFLKEEHHALKRPFLLPQPIQKQKAIRTQIDLM